MYLINIPRQLRPNALQHLPFGDAQKINVGGGPSRAFSALHRFCLLAFKIRQIFSKLKLFLRFIKVVVMGQGYILKDGWAFKSKFIDI